MGRGDRSFLAAFPCARPRCIANARNWRSREDLHLELPPSQDGVHDSYTSGANEKWCVRPGRRKEWRRWSDVNAKSPWGRRGVVKFHGVLQSLRLLQDDSAFEISFWRIRLVRRSGRTFPGRRACGRRRSGGRSATPNPRRGRGRGEAGGKGRGRGSRR